MRKRGFFKPILGFILVGSLLGMAPAWAAPFRDCQDVCPEMVQVPAGSFIMGSPANEEGRYNNEGPQHAVQISYGMAVGRYPVTRAEFSAFVAQTGYDAANDCWGFNARGDVENIAGHKWRDPGFSQTGRNPVVCVTWDDAQAYALWLSRKTGHTYRLLTEAEYEYATRAGTSNARYWGESAVGQCQNANGADQTIAAALTFIDKSKIADCSDGYAFTSPVGNFQPNPFGLYDMLGNVWEWTQDCYNQSYQGAPTDGSAWQSGDCSQRVRRGGGFEDDPRLVRSAGRRSIPSVRKFNLGFRVARTN
jgi:sulfatase modifying factor 1